MSKLEFMNLMRFPVEWEVLGMYPDELFEFQYSNYEPGQEAASEHDRNGAFHWWLRHSPTKFDLVKLLKLAAVDPDEFLRHDVRQYISKSSAFDSDLNDLSNDLFDKARLL